VVKKAYCNWERYQDFKRGMHEAAFELIEIPHVRQSGKNSADIRMVVDALDLCYTKAHVDTFVIVSGDSDFSPLVSKLRENAKTVIGVGVKNSSSDLLINNCDEFIYYDDLVRDQPKREKKARMQRREKPAAGEADKAQGAKPDEEKRQQALDLAMETIEALFAERGADEKIWGSMVKQALKRRKPGFNETYYGFRSFSRLLDEDRDMAGHIEAASGHLPLPAGARSCASLREASCGARLLRGRRYRRGRLPLPRPGTLRLGERRQGHVPRRLPPQGEGGGALSHRLRACAPGADDPGLR